MVFPQHRDRPLLGDEMFSQVGNFGVAIAIAIAGCSGGGIGGSLVVVVALMKMDPHLY